MRGIKGKILSLGIAITLTFSMLIGCSNNGAGSEFKKPVSIGAPTLGAGKEEKPVETYTGPKSSYMIYYSVLNDEIMEIAKHYEVVILHPRMGNITREQVRELQDSGCTVLGYISIGEDLRTYGKTAEDMLQDSRFTVDGSGPRVDPRAEGDSTLDNVSLTGNPSDGGTGYASFYLDDNDHNGQPDVNVNFGCAFTNIGDPLWYDALNEMTFDGVDGIPGIREILTLTYGRGLGCDGLFLDTIDTAAPNFYTADTDANKTRYEWTAPGVLAFCKHLKEDYPDKQVLQNRGMFMFNTALPMFKYNPRTYIDYLLVESYRLDSNPTAAYSDGFFRDNKYTYAPKIMAEANRKDGFRVLSLGYAEGPEEYHMKETLNGESVAGMGILMEDIYEAQELAGYEHYITDGYVVAANTFVIDHEKKKDDIAPVWTSVYNASPVWPPDAPEPRVGIQQIEAIKGGVVVRYDVAMDRNKVIYQLYYQDHPFDFEKDPDLSEAKCVILDPEVGDGYDHYAEDVYPNRSEVTGLDAGVEYYFVLRARDNSERENEEKNQVVMTATPLK